MTTQPSLRISYIDTFTGKQLDPFNPRPDQVDARDIAAGLASVTRFAGQLPYFYCVAEHSVLVARLATHGDLAQRGLFQTVRGWPVEEKERRLARFALTHDAEEAYLGDLIAPVKHHPAFMAYRALARGLRNVVVDALNGAQPTAVEDAAIHAADQRAYALERDPAFHPVCATWCDARIAWLDAWGALRD